MNVVTCVNKHFFDSEKYEVCPHCGAPVALSGEEGSQSRSKSEERSGSRLSFFGRNSKKQNRQSAEPELVWNSDPSSAASDSRESESRETQPETSRRETQSETSHRETLQQRSETPEKLVSNTIDIWQTGSLTTPEYDQDDSYSGASARNEEPQPDARARYSDPRTAQSVRDERAQPDVRNVRNEQADRGMQSGWNEQADRGMQSGWNEQADRGMQNGRNETFDRSASVPETSPAQNGGSAASAGSLRETVRSASANTEGKTLSYFSMQSAAMGRQESRAEAAAPEQTENTEPVVGWLVCIQGPHIGMSFPLRTGINSIGRSGSNYVVLPRDAAISREKHALLTYEPKKRVFYLKSGESSGLTYVNEDVVFETQRLSPRDVIELGKTKLMLVPLCGEDFSWETYFTP